MTDEKTDQKNKMKTLVSEVIFLKIIKHELQKKKLNKIKVKSLRNKNQEMETNWKNLISDCLEIKIQFEKIPMDV